MTNDKINYNTVSPVIHEIETFWELREADLELRYDFEDSWVSEDNWKSSGHRLIMVKLQSSTSDHRMKRVMAYEILSHTTLEEIKTFINETISDYILTL